MREIEAVKLINMADVEVEEVKWLLYPFIPYGKITILQGDPGEGKTTAMLHIIAGLTRGESPLPTEKENDDCREPVNVIYQTAEDGLEDTIKPRLLSAGADCSKVMVIDESEKALTVEDDRLEAAIKTKEAMDFLEEFLLAGSRPSTEVEKAAQARGISKATLRNAKGRLGVESRKIVNQWWNELKKREEDAKMLPS